MKISLTKKQICCFASKYAEEGAAYAKGETALSEQLQAGAESGYILWCDLIAVAKWKWHGGQTWRLCAENEPDDVERLSAASFSSDCDCIRISALRALHGVNWPMASVILHFAFPNQYPILDANAMKSVGSSPHYSLKRWQEYITLCKKRVDRDGIDMRTLDKALWVHGKELLAGKLR